MLHVYEDIGNWYAMTPLPHYYFHDFEKLPFYLARQNILDEFAPTVFSTRGPKYDAMVGNIFY